MATLCLAVVLLFGGQATAPFNFRSISINQNALDWQVENEQPFGQFFVQKKRVHTWVSFKVVNCKGDAGLVSYSTPAKLTTGRNHFRIKYLDITGKSYYSPEVSYLKRK